MRSGAWLDVDLVRPHRCAGWTIVGGGLSFTRRVAWRQVQADDLSGGSDERAWLERELAVRRERPDAVFLTSRDLRAWRSALARDSERSDLWARAIATVGLSNALRAGDAPGPLDRGPGTINVAVIASVALTDEALIETLALVAEARTLAVVEARIASRRSALCASGTGTDCLLAAAPVGPDPQRYAGKHTALGACVGSAVHAAVRDGIAGWLAERSDGWRLA